MSTDSKGAARAKAHLAEASGILASAAERCATDADAAARMIADALGRGGKLMLCGNGGSAADSQHIAAEFVSCLDHKANPRSGLAAIALTTDTSVITAHGNDFGFEGIFARQVQALGNKGDVLMGFSTSGESENVLLAFATARKAGIATIAMTGGKGGRLAGQADIALRVPSASTAHIQEAHIALGHAITAEVERILDKGGGA